MNTNIFDQWFMKIFIPNCGASADKPVLLIIDNCSTHYSLKVIKAAQENNIHILCEPPHTSHLLQPLDKIFFNLKDAFNKICYTSKVVDAHAFVGKGNMAIVLNDAQENAWSKGVIKSGFKRTGIFPLNRSQIDNSLLVGKRSFSIPSSSTPSAASTSATNQTQTPTSSLVCPSCGAHMDPKWKCCPFCGSGRKKNILVELGLVSPELQDVIVPPNKPEESKIVNRRSGVAEGTLITGMY
jgi:hypothetical protein